MKKLLLIMVIMMITAPIFAQQLSLVSINGEIKISSIKIYHAGSGNWQIEPLAEGSIIKIRDAATKQIISTHDAIYQNDGVLLDLQAVRDKITLLPLSTYFENLTSNMEETTSEARIGTVLLTVYDAQGKRIGDIAQSNVGEIASAIKDDQKIEASIMTVVYCSDKFSFKDSSNMMGFDTKIDLNLVKGWNNLLYHTSSGADGVSMLISTDVTTCKPVEWLVMLVDSKPNENLNLE